ncbi:MAG TPA: MFS transporter [Firmicutes bacterium]|jgi:EmrB/QacA subfamily drug resistance transporter|nr:MFS transporter [Bacillota bacterium]
MQKNKLAESQNKWITLFVVVTMSFMSCLDSSIVNVALPVMTKELAVPISSIEWVVVGYLIIICASLLIFGRLGDMIGKSKVFKFGTALFTTGSLLCGLSRSFVMLIGCRIIQGIGASAYMANNQGIITQIFPNTERGKALGILASVVALGTMLGPPMGGLILSALNWNFIFLINVPIGMIAFALELKILPKNEKTDERMDITGAVLFFTATVFLFGALIIGQKVGYSNSFIITAIVLAVVLIIWFIRQEVKQIQPLLELKIFKNQIFSLSLICALISFICLNASIILLPFYLQDTMKISPVNAGLFMMISPLIVTVFSPLSGAFSDRIGSGLLTVIGLLAMSGGFYLMSFLNEYSLLGRAAVFVAVMAVGQGLFQPANNSLIMSAVPQNKLGIAGSVNSLVRNLGQVVGVTLSTTLLYSFMSQKLQRHVFDYVIGKDDIFIYGMRHVYIILVEICCIGGLFTLFRLYQNKYLKSLRNND